MQHGKELSTTPVQLDFDLQIAAEREVDGVQMGVLSNGSAFITLRGLARMCGVDHSMIVRITEGWTDALPKPRERRIRELVKQQGADDSRAFIAIEKGGVIYHAVPDAVCMAVLEYYAFEAKPGSEQAQTAYRTLARKGFRDFVYAQVGYTPNSALDLAWQQFQDRVSLVYDNVPPGYFCVFKEIDQLIVTLIQGGAQVGNKFIPDGSVGIHWSKHWQGENLDAVYGMRRKYDHNYPHYFPQSLSNPQEVFCYPDEALAEFRKWLREEYVPNKMPSYLANKIKDGTLPQPAAVKVLDAFKGKSIPRVR